MAESTVKKKRSEQRKRNILKAFRLNAEEAAAFQAQCERLNLSGGDLFRSKCCGLKPLLQNRPRRHGEVELARILAELNKWGSNVNQVAHALNIAKQQPEYSPSYAEQTLRMHQKNISDIHSAIQECRTMIREILLNRDFAR